MIDVVRRTTPADADALRSFTCSHGLWYEEEAQRFLRRGLADGVAAGHPAWVVEADGDLVAVAAHAGVPHPDGSQRLITQVTILATRVEDDDRSWLAQGLRVSRLVQAMRAEMRIADRALYWYSVVAAENTKMCRWHERSGFIARPVPSDPRYLFFVARAD